MPTLAPPGVQLCLRRPHHPTRDPTAGNESHRDLDATVVEAACCGRGLLRRTRASADKATVA
jgi:hypothetical protein